MVRNTIEDPPCLVAMAGTVLAGDRKSRTMNLIRHHPSEELTEFEMEWHHLRIARRSAEWIAVLAFIAALGYVLRPYLMR